MRRAPDVAKAPAVSRRVIRIELSGAHRRRFSEMAREAGVSVDDLASRLLSDLIDDDAKAHGATG